jgi:hypothetical protein
MQSNVELLAWQWTPGWRDCLTLTIASMTLIATVIISGVTLRRNTRQFEQSRIESQRQFQQGRADEVTDTLRVEMIGLSTAVIERRPRFNIIRRRLYDLEVDDDVDSVGESETFQEGARALLTEELSSFYDRIQAHAGAILMLTKEPAILRPTTEIAFAAQQERQEYFDGIPLTDEVELEEHRRRLEELNATIENASDDLMTYGINHLLPDFGD